MAKSRGRPALGASRRSRRAHSEWNVESHGCAGGTPARSSKSETRLRISSAALLVKVTARMDSAGTPRAMRLAMRKVIARVLPVPAPASSSTGPSVVSAATRCCGFNSSSRVSMGPRVREFFCTAMVAEGNEWRKRAPEFAVRNLDLIAADRGTNAELLASALTEIDVEIRERAVAAHQHQIRHVEVRGLQQVELVLQIEIQEPLHRAVRRDDAGGHAGLLRFFLQVIPVLIFPASGYCDRYRQFLALGGIFACGFQDRLRQFHGRERREFLLVVSIKTHGQADTREFNLDAVVGIVAKGNLNGKDSGRIG